jgi:hypothetical protein
MSRTETRQWRRDTACRRAAREVGGKRNSAEPWASGAENGARRHADCRALARLPEQKTGDESGRRKPNEGTGGASSPTEACPRTARKLTRKRDSGSSAKTSARRTRQRGPNPPGWRKRDENPQRRWRRAARESGLKIGSTGP